MLEQGDTAVFGGTLHEGIYIYISETANYLGIAKSKRNAFFSAKGLEMRLMLV